MRVLSEDKFQLVTTISGKKVPRNNTRKIKNLYYETNVDCFKVKNNADEVKWYRVNSGKIAYDVVEKKWDLIGRLSRKPNYVQGVIDESFNPAFFPVNAEENVVLFQNYGDNLETGVICIDVKTAESLGYVEAISNGFYYKKSNLSKTQLSNLKKKKWQRYDSGPLSHFDYFAREGNRAYMHILQNHRRFYSDKTFKPNYKVLNKIIGPYSFGLEFETYDGTIPEKHLAKGGIVPLKDGSLRRREGDREIIPYEYTTVPLRGEIGIETIRHATQNLSKYCEIGNKCSMHLHIGGAPIEKEFLIAFYILAYRLQDEFFEMFPLYKTDAVNIIGSDKNYCKKLPAIGLVSKNNIYQTNSNAEFRKNLKVYFDKLFSFLADNRISGESSEFNLDTKKHPSDPRGTQKWQIGARYYYINMVPTIFQNSGTIEFRLHTPTTNFCKTMNWLLICLAMIKYARIHKRTIINTGAKGVTLDKVVEGYSNVFGQINYDWSYANDLVKYLKYYIKERKAQFKISSEKPLDIEGKKEMSADIDYVLSKYNFKESVLEYTKSF